MKILDNKEIGQLIKAYRKLRGFTQFQLAESAEIDEKQIGKIERGVHFPSVPTFLKIIKTLNIDIDKFYIDPERADCGIELIDMLQNSTRKEIELVCKFLKTVKNM